MKKGQGKPLWLSSKVREKNEKKLKDVLKNVPNARAKWAKVVLDMATELHKKSMELINKANK